ncbi:MAG: peptidoglycan bridge formation protein FemAB [Micavibrio sp.]|nr:MAG: peptidoglycan bridge formation protein FemAB [Micavibrio sp.]
MKIFVLKDNKKESWNEFVHANPQGTFFHLAEWKDVIELSFGCKTYYLYAEEGGVITGVLPLALVKRPIFGPVLISTPLCVYGGALGDTKELEEAAAKKAQALGVQYLELRSQTQSRQDWPVSNRFYTFRRALSDDNEENLKAIPRKQRAEVRKGMAINLQTSVNQDINIFYKIYAESVRNLGTPVFSKQYLKDLITIFGKSCEITTIGHQGRALTSVLNFRYKDQILPYYGGGISDARHFSAYPYMYWKVMERAAQEGFKVFDFGRSMEGSGAFSFKKNFGFEPQKLSYQYHLVKAQELPDMDPDSQRNKFLTDAWKLLPLPIANRLGPILYPVIM